MSLSFEEALRAADERPGALDEEGLATLLAADGEEQLRTLYYAAHRVKERIIGRNVSIRALVEISNVCAKDCYYCGIRKSNASCHRYSLGRERGLLAGANVIMPNFTELEYRKEYSLYEGKTAAGDFNLSAPDRRIVAIGEKILYNQRGDTKHKKTSQ